MCCLLLSTLYGVAAASLFGFLKYYRNQSNVTLVEILLLPLPGHWAQYEAKQGRTLIEHSLSLFRAGNFKAAMHSLRVGLAKAPDHRDGLLLLAQLQAELRRPDLAEGTLLGGLKHQRYDPIFLKAVLGFLFTHQKDSQALTLCTELLKQPNQSPIGSELAQTAALGAAIACYDRGNYDQATAYLSQHQLFAQRDGGLLYAKIQWDLGYHELAFHQLRILTETFPNDEDIYGQLSGYLRADARFQEARQLSLVFQLAQPDSARPRIDLLRDSMRTMDSVGWNTEAEATIHHFSQNATALLALAELAATSGKTELARKIQIPLTQLGHGPEAALLAIEALVSAKNYQAALTAIDDLAKQTPAPAKHFLNICSGLQAIAHFGNQEPEAGLLSLKTYLVTPNLRTANLVAVANRLREIGADQPARETLAHAVSADPLNQAALSRLIEFDLEDGNTEALPANIRRLLLMRKPSQKILGRARQQLGSDRWLFSRDHTLALEAIASYLVSSQAVTFGAATN